MRRHSFQAWQAPRRRLFAPLVWLLVAALLVASQAAVLSQWLGHAHWHRAATASATTSTPSPAPALLAPVLAMVAKIQSLRELAHAQSRARTSDLTPYAHGSARTAPHAAPHTAPHKHSHGLFERHHHERSDASVVTLDAGDDTHTGNKAEPASQSTATAVLGPISEMPLPASTKRSKTWLQGPDLLWCSTHPTPLERPPSA